MNKQYNKLINIDIIKQNIKDNQYPNSSMNTLADDTIRHFLSESSVWHSTAEFTDAKGNVSKGIGISEIKVCIDKIINNSHMEFEGAIIHNDYEIRAGNNNVFHSSSINPALGIQRGRFFVNGSKLFHDFIIENSSMRGFEIIRRDGNICFSDGALYDADALINTWSAILRK